MTRVLYNFLIIFFYIPFVFIIFFRKFINKEDKFKFKEKFFFSNFKRPSGFLFWFHVASIGELNSIFPIIDFYLKKNKNYNFIITTITLSSYNEYKKKYGTNNRVQHQFLPYDFKPLVNNFFNNWKPNIVSFVDSEIWPNFIHKIKKEKLPFILLNARITKKTFDRWMIFKGFARDLFSSFSLCIASSKETRDFLKKLNANNVKYFGNIKFCTPVYKKKYLVEEFESIKNKDVWCALSTHENEEFLCGLAHKIIKKHNRNIITIIIPRHIERIKTIRSNLEKMNLSTQVKGETEPIGKNAEIILVNYYGSTQKYLQNFRQVFIGKSMIKKLEKVGGQNPINAAKMGCRIYHGPYVYNFKEIYNYLGEKKLAEKVGDYKDLADNLRKNFENKISIKENEVQQLHNYSEKIFDELINEYKNFINENI
tara:strand:+ start:6843 stop:8117 length:1275 start_codon:yes stop_codon:yes gene_type:complete